MELIKILLVTFAIISLAGWVGAGPVKDLKGKSEESEERKPCVHAAACGSCHHRCREVRPSFPPEAYLVDPYAHSYDEVQRLRALRDHRRQETRPEEKKSDRG
jgi:cytochrome c553